LSPSRASPIARALPTRRGRKYVPPESGTRPILENACRHAFDGAHDRQRQRLQCQHERLVVLLDRRAEIDGRRAGRDVAIGQVLSGTKAAAFAGQEQHARGRVLLHPRERIAQLAMHVAGEAVQPVGARERDARDAAGAFESNLFVRHGFT
jgi:hypothetical protein